MAAVMLMIDAMLPEGLLSFSWGTASVVALLTLDVSSLMGEFYRLVEQKNGSSSREDDDHDRSILLKQQRKIVTKTAVSTAFAFLLLYFASGVVIGFSTRDMDVRMRNILEGLSRLVAAVAWLCLSIEMPKWIGIIHSPSATSWLKGRKVRIQHHNTTDDRDTEILLKSYVRSNLIHLFGISYFLILPFVGKLVSFMVGILIGLVLDVYIYASRHHLPVSSNQTKWQTILAYFLALDLGLGSAFFFASACHYIQTVWNIKYIPHEKGLLIGSFIIWTLILLYIHWSFYTETKTILETHRRISTAAKGERTATSLLVNKFEEQMKLKDAVLSDVQEDRYDYGAVNTNDNTDSNTTAFDDTTEDETSEREFTTHVRYRWIQRTLWFASTFLSLFIVASNIGATYQMNLVRERLPVVDQTLYDRMNEGPVCGLELTNRTVSSFETPAAAHAAGFGVAHCGACGACSTWHNLRLQYTTRKHLADESAYCARKSLTGGRAASLDCLKTNPKIGFAPDCAECWVDDILCAKSHCFMIFLQSALINKISNFKVSESDVTSATCEEAFCELDFVPCSGANRRRMDIESSIARSEKQRCHLVDFTWKEVFGSDDDEEEDEAQ